MTKTKPVSIQSNRMSKADLKARMEHEDQLKGKTPIPIQPPSSLCPRGQELYLEILESLPPHFLCNLDVHNLTIICDSLANMEKCREIINREGLIIESPQGKKSNPATVTLAKYSEIYKKYSDSIGIFSPTGRANLALQKHQKIEDQEDPLLKVLSKRKKA
jgi:P27 family predicted phage terminase small subunit